MLLNTVSSNPIVAYVWPFIQHKLQEIKARNLRFALKSVIRSDVLIQSYERAILGISWLLFRVKYPSTHGQLIWFKYRKFKVDCCIIMSRQTSNVAISSWRNVYWMNHARSSRFFFDKRCPMWRHRFFFFTDREVYRGDSLPRSSEYWPNTMANRSHEDQPCSPCFEFFD